MRKIALIGGDCRQIHAAATLEKAGFLPFVFGNDGAAKEGFTAPYTLKETLADAEAVILPVPSVKKKGFLHCPLSEGSVSLTALTDVMPKSTTVFLWAEQNCPLPDSFRVVDLEKDEQLQTENAILTAEAAICLAMERTKRSFVGARVAVVGNGRIGRSICPMAKALGAQVTVVAREGKNKELARQTGFLLASPEKTALFAETDLIFNTVPAPILAKNCFLGMPRHLLYLELASKPGGLMPDTASLLGQQVIDGAGLPGKFFPFDAGKRLAEAIMRHLEVRSW